jgi:hypothetical protein
MKRGEEDELEAIEMLNQHLVWQEPLSEGVSFWVLQNPLRKWKPE